MKKILRLGITLLSSLIIVACSNSQFFPKEDPTLTIDLPEIRPVSEPVETLNRQTMSDVASTEKAEPKNQVLPGTGVFMNKAWRAKSSEEEGSITLNFEDTDIREVVKVIVGDMLGENYVVDSNVKGSVTLQTGRPLNQKDLLPTLETLLRMNGAVITKAGGLYRVIPMSIASRGLTTPKLADRHKFLPHGYSVVAIPLRYISVSEMTKILKPLAPQNALLYNDPIRNLLMIAGTGDEIQHLLETVDIFDVNWMTGMSVGLFGIESADAKAIAKELDEIFGSKKGPLSGVIRMIPIERINSLLVVTPQKAYLREVGDWIKRLDQGGEAGGGERLHVYKVQNSKAEHLASLLNDVFGKQGSKKKAPVGKVAPGLKGKTVSTSRPPKPGQKRTAIKKTTTSIAKHGADLAVGGDVKIIADEENNALLILATPRDYDKIILALRRLDVLPLQVLVEASIIEIKLTDDLKYGMQWFFNDHVGGKIGTSSFDGSIDSSAASGLGKIFPGFNYTLADSAGQVRAVLSTLASDSKINVLSSPSIMVLDNHTAEIQVGDEVPLSTQQQQSTVDTNAAIVNSIEYRKTGVTLSVTPRVNSGGLVTMEITQDVSNVAQTSTSGIDSPTINNRTINSTIVVQSGETIVLGGLIREDKSRSKSGVPILYKVPVIGNLFGQTETTVNRTELLILITPRVVGSVVDARQVTRELRDKMQGLRIKTTHSTTH